MSHTDDITRLRALHGERGAAWLDALPGRLEMLRHRWRIVEMGDAFAGTHASFVAAARNSAGADLVIKLVPDGHAAFVEAAALRYWAGRGAVRLIEADPEVGALLLERAAPGEDLVGPCLSDDRKATAVATSVIAALRERRGEPLAGLPDVAGWVTQLRPVLSASPPPELAAAWRRATDVAADLLAEGGATLLHGDLHHGNILASRRSSWVAIDPKGVIGPRAAEAAGLLRNPRHHILSHADPLSLLSDRVDILVERLGDDERLLLQWGFVLAVVAAGWAFEDGEGEAEVGGWLACAELLDRVMRVRRMR